MQYNKNLSVITPNNAIKNALILSINIMLISVSNEDENIGNLNNNISSNRCSI